MMNAFSEGLVLAAESGISQQTLLKVLVGIAFQKTIFLDVMTLMLV